MAKATTKKAAVPAVKTQTTALAIPTTDRYLAGFQNLDVSVFDNLGGDQLSPFDLDRTKIPAGGGLVWSIPTIEGEKSAPTFSGIVIEQRSVRSYFEKEYDGENTPPLCASQDGMIGNGDPGGSCADCPFAEWGSSPKKGSEGQACKQGRILFILKEGNILPDILALPPTSIKPWRKFMQGLIKTNTPLFAVEIEFGLVKAQNKKGIAYAAVAPRVGARLDQPTIAALRTYRLKIKSLLETRVALEQGDVDGPAAGEEE